MAIAVIIALVALAGNIAGAKHALAVIIGAVAGFGLYHASFGFTSAWRRVVTEKRGAGVRAQFALIILTSAVSFPLLAYGNMIGFPTIGSIAPISVALVFGAFLFGMGMQFGGGCGSGTLFTVGGGSMRMIITLAAFVTGSLAGTYHLPWWRSLPKTGGWSMVESLGPFVAFLALAGILLGATYFTIRREKSAHGELEEPRQTASILRGPWSPTGGILALAAVGIASFMILGRPWGITSAFSLWGAKAASLAGVDVASWPYWSARAGLLNRSVFADSTSVMNFGIVAGAMAASALASKYRPVWRLNRAEVATAIIGGLLMGYGARLAYGCNIGAYLGGVVSGSLHGWIWLIAAFAGSALTVRYRSKLGI